MKSKIQAYTRQQHPKVGQRYTGFPSSLLPLNSAKSNNRYTENSHSHWEGGWKVMWHCPTINSKWLTNQQWQSRQQADSIFQLDTFWTAWNVVIFRKKRHQEIKRWRQTHGKMMGVYMEEKKDPSERCRERSRLLAEQLWDCLLHEAKHRLGSVLSSMS